MFAGRCSFSGELDLKAVKKTTWHDVCCGLLVGGCVTCNLFEDEVLLLI